MLVAVLGLYFRGLNLGIEFVGGAQYSVTLPTDQVNQDNADKLREAVAGTGIDAAQQVDRHDGRQEPSWSRPSR